MIDRVTSGVVEGLKSQPLALSLVVVNVMFLAAFAWALSNVADSNHRRDQMILQLFKDCGTRP